MRLTWLSNAPWAATGYGNQTKVFTPRLKALGHDIAIIAFYGLEGAMLQWSGIQVFPRGQHQYGQDVMAAHSVQFGADVMISLMDAWVVEPGLLQSVRWCPWFPIDMEPLPKAIFERVRQAYQPIVYSRFGERVARDAGLRVHYVPHGVDCSVFKPIDRSEARERLYWPQDRYIIGMVAANKGYPSRKALPEHLMAFAEFHRRHPDTVLYVHSQSGRDNQHGAIDLTALVRQLEIQDAVMFAEEYSLLLGYPDRYLLDLYNGIDVLAAASYGEGFGLPILEAQACGTPVIVGNWSSMPELCCYGWPIDPYDSEKVWTGLGAYQRAPCVGALIEAFDQAYRHGRSVADARMAREQALRYDADVVTRDYWQPVLAEIEARLHAESRSFAEAARV